MRIFPVIIALAALSVVSAEPTWPLWDGKETVKQYAARVDLPMKKTLDLGNGVTLEFALIPAGQFTIGTPEPEPVNEAHFITQIALGKAALEGSVCLILAIVTFVALRSLRDKHRPQVSLARLLILALIASLGLLGGLHWRYSARAFAEARAAYELKWSRYAFSGKAERPSAELVLPEPYYMAKYEITQEQYQEVMDGNPSGFRGASLPVERVSWYDARTFCERVRQTTRQAVRLPSEAEWEYACRAGTTTMYYSGDDEADLDRVAWSWANANSGRTSPANRSTFPVGQKEPNAFALHDMHGNVSEWCAAWLDYGTGSNEHPPVRGGSWIGSPWFCRSACRCGSEDLEGTYPYYRSNHIGFRVVMDLVPRPM